MVPHAAVPSGSFRDRPADQVDVEIDVDVDRPEPRTAVVRLVGEIDLLTAPQCARALHRASEDLLAERTAPDPGLPRAPRLVCDLSEVTFLSASGVSVLVEAVHLARAADMEFRVVATGRPVLRILGLAGLGAVVPVVADLTDVLRDAAGRSA